MKLTESQLRSMIQEEIALLEGERRGLEAIKSAISSLVSALASITDPGVKEKIELTKTELEQLAADDHFVYHQLRDSFL